MKEKITLPNVFFFSHVVSCPSESHPCSLRRLSLSLNLCNVGLQHLKLGVLIITPANCSIIFHVIDCNPVDKDWLRTRKNQDSSIFFVLFRSIA